MRERHLRQVLLLPGQAEARGKTVWQLQARVGSVRIAPYITDDSPARHSRDRRDPKPPQISPSLRRVGRYPGGTGRSPLALLDQQIAFASGPGKRRGQPRVVAVSVDADAFSGA
jgi:hypothetical protein